MPLFQQCPFWSVTIIIPTFPEAGSKLLLLPKLMREEQEALWLEKDSVVIGRTPGGGGHPLDLHALTPGTLSTGLKWAYLFSTFVIKIEVGICFPQPISVSLLSLPDLEVVQLLWRS